MRVLLMKWKRISSGSTTFLSAFQKIGSVINLTEENIVPVIDEAVVYLKNRTSKNIHYHYNFSVDEVVVAPVNKYLFQWVIESLCKNAVDAMNGKGSVYQPQRR
ncbi:MAG: hypothetical protein U5L09_16875 [Bacteroidales bacterium]|nr:hypothetical protein [Bacteroidales bacterium]